MTELETRTYRSEAEQELRSARSPLTKILAEQARIQELKTLDNDALSEEVA
jgi:hypothetical protein